MIGATSADGSAVDECLSELAREHGPIPPQALEWAAEVVGDWGAARGKRPRPAAG